MRLWLLRLWFCRIRRIHNVWERVTYGVQLNYRTGSFGLVEPETRRTCLYCKKDFD
jgi:hypothetical protein